MLFHQVGGRPAAGSGDVKAEHTMTMSAADEADVHGSAGTTTASMPPGSQRVVSGSSASGTQPAPGGGQRAPRLGSARRVTACRAR